MVLVKSRGNWETQCSSAGKLSEGSPREQYPEICGANIIILPVYFVKQIYIYWHMTCTHLLIICLIYLYINQGIINLKQIL